MECEWIQLNAIDIHSYPKTTKNKQVGDETENIIHYLLFAFNNDFLLDFSPLFRGLAKKAFNLRIATQVDETRVLIAMGGFRREKG